jgi:hypothetical protein
MDTDNNQVNAEITRIIDLTKAGQLVWEKVCGSYCYYQTVSETQPRLVISCCRPEYRAEVEGRRLDARPEQLMILCGEIIKQIRQAEQQKDDVVRLLRAIH